MTASPRGFRTGQRRAAPEHDFARTHHAGGHGALGSQTERRNGTNSNRGQMGSDDTISIVPSLAHRPIGLRGVVGEDASVMQD